MGFTAFTAGTGPPRADLPGGADLGAAVFAAALVAVFWGAAIFFGTDAVVMPLRPVVCAVRGGTIGSIFLATG